MKFLTLLLLLLTHTLAQENLERIAASLVLRDDVRIHWSSDSGPLAWRVDTARDQHEFFTVDPTTGKKSPAFNHQLFADALEKASGQKSNPKQLPLEQIDFASDGRSFRFRAHGKSWKFDGREGAIAPDDTPPKSAELLAPEQAPRGTRNHGNPVPLTIENATGSEIEMFWVAGDGKRNSYGKLPNGNSAVQQTYAGHLWLVTDANNQPLAAIETPDTPALARITGKINAPKSPPQHHSPDGKWAAHLRDNNVIIEPLTGGESFPLTTDGNPNDAYQWPIHWSPDSKKLVVFRSKSVDQRRIHIVESSPKDQLQPKLRTHDYTKPGDPIRQPKPRLFNITTRQQIPLDDALYQNPWSINDHAWSPDSAEFSFVYNQRGHQIIRIIGIDSSNGNARAIHEESSKSFIDYSQKSHLTRIPETREIIWASERDGYNHLYLIDEISGSIKKQITKGNWNVRQVLDVDPAKRQLLLKIVGFTGQDPYHEHFVRVNFDGSAFTKLTDGDGTHRIDFSPDRKHLIATWSRVDQPPVTELRDATSGKKIAELERADDSALTAAGAPPVERFTAKGRDGKTDIFGIIVKPANFDPNKKYPVVEDIYAGPHDHFVPKSYSPWSGARSMAAHGFIIVHIDGMGTNWRSKAFHDVAWKNLSDSGFPDRIPWLKAAAKDRPWMDLTRVGIFGGSAGGQSTLAALLHHGDFYKVGVADCGCHDNRMDKIWWNEAWMGWPIDDSYEKNSNTTHAAKLTGKLMLIVGELDSNVDPASTAQVVHALQQAGKDFEFVPIINAGHGAAETPYGRMKRLNFLKRHLLGSES
jgi:dipeptidyl aminopeptidase/acylaminoacyl peptidase